MLNHFLEVFQVNIRIRITLLLLNLHSEALPGLFSYEGPSRLVVKDRFFLPKDKSFPLCQEGLRILIHSPFHTVSEGILDKGHCFHVLAAIRVIITILVENHIQVELSRGYMQLIIPEIEWKQGHSKLVLKVLSYLFGEWLDVGHKVKALLFLHQF